MGRKVFISILGTGPYSECSYGINDKPIMTTRYIQLATIKSLIQKGIKENNEWTENDKAFIFVTKESESDQWVIGKTKGKDGSQKTEDGLKVESEKMNLPFRLTPIRIDNGKSETEIWKIFNTIYYQIKENDELYFDITHAFRYLPMLLLVLINHSKFLKNINVKSITYGNFMAAEEIKPIMDLTSFSMLQDWTYAAGQYLDSGNVNKLVELKPFVKSDELVEVVNTLESVIKERQTCRGMLIHNSETVTKLKSCLSNCLAKSDNLESDDEPLRQILEKVDMSLKKFDSKINFMNGFYAAEWCVKNGLFQQAITMLRENFVTLFCERHNFEIKNKDERYLVETALNIQINHLQNKKKKWPEGLSEEQQDKIESILQDEWIKSKDKHNNALIHVYKDIRDYRNNFNHAGFNEGCPSPKEIEIKVNEFVKKTIDIFENLIQITDIATSL